MGGAAIHLSRSHSLSEMLQAGSGSEVRRYLPPGRPIELYWHYSAWARLNDVKCGSLSSFYRGFRLVFNRLGFLKFRKRKVRRHESWLSDGVGLAEVLSFGDASAPLGLGELFCVRKDL